MIEITKTHVCGWEAAIRGMRNPLNSWERSDSSKNMFGQFTLGKQDKALAMKLAKSGSDHAKFLRMIAVYADIKAPWYWWKEFDTYKVGTVANSCSTMHKITSRHIMHEDLSYEYLDNASKEILGLTCDRINSLIDSYNETKNKSYWYQIIQLLPSCYMQKRTVMLNYEVLSNMYRSRNNHKLEEWHDFCDWILELPYHELITKMPFEED